MTLRKPWVLALIVVIVLAIAGVWGSRFAFHRATPVSWLTPQTAPEEIRAGLASGNAAMDRTRTAMQQKLADFETQRHERDAKEIEARLARVREAGGPRESLRRELERIRLGRSDPGAALADKTARLRALVELPCQVPTIWLVPRACPIGSDGAEEASDDADRHGRTFEL